jgi:transcription initiation factor TFIID subunit 11
VSLSAAAARTKGQAQKEQEDEEEEDHMEVDLDKLPSSTGDPDKLAKMSVCPIVPLLFRYLCLI